MTQFLKKLKTPQSWAPNWQTVLSAAMIVLAFPPWGFWPLIWICLIPWLNAVRTARTPRSAALQGFWLSYFMCFLGFYWVAAVLEEFGDLPWILSFLGLQVFCLYGQIQFTLFAPLLNAWMKVWDSLPKKRLPWRPSRIGEHLEAVGEMAFLAAVYTGLDWVLPKEFMDTLGHALYRAKYLRQIADLGGASLLTFVIFSVNWTLWKVWNHYRHSANTLGHSGKHTREFTHYRSWTLVTNIVLLLVPLWGYGFLRWNQIQVLIQSAPQKLQAAAIQGNIGDFEKLAAERGVVGAAHRIIETYTQLSDQALKQTPKPDFLIWPETSYPSTFRTPQTTIELSLDDAVEQFVTSRGVPLLFGGYDRYQQRDYNSFFFLTQKGQLQTYHKNKLLLFGEYIPGADFFPFIKTAFPQVGNFGRGQGPEVINVDVSHSNPALGSVRVSPTICYEALFPPYVIDSARQGSQLILNITNDSWFGTWGEPQLHLALSIFRSIETRLPTLRATNTGISALILPDGEIQESTEIGVKKVMSVTVPIVNPSPTLMKTWGDWFGLSCAILGLLGVLLTLRRFPEQLSKLLTK